LQKGLFSNTAESIGNVKKFKTNVPQINLLPLVLIISYHSRSSTKIQLTLESGKTQIYLKMGPARPDCLPVPDLQHKQ